MQVKFKKLVKHAILPEYATDGSNGLDLVAIDYCYDMEFCFHEFGTGLAVEIPKDHVGLLFPRSSVSKKSLILANCVGVIDSDYTGEIKLRFKDIDDREDLYEVPDRIGQLLIIPCPKIEVIETTNLNITGRGAGGFGSSGN